MNLRNRLASAAVATACLVAAACSSSGATGSGNQESSIPLDIAIKQISAVPVAAEHVAGDIPIRYAVQVANRGGEEVRLQRVLLTSLGSGAYTLVGPSQSPFDVAIAPGKFATVELWASGRLNDTILGANGPVTIRVTATFKWSGGSFQRTEIQQVGLGS